MLVPELIDRSPTATHAITEVRTIKSEQAIVPFDELAGFARQQQHCLEWIEQHVRSDGFAEMYIPDVLFLDRLVDQIIELQVFPRPFVLAAAARTRSNHILHAHCCLRVGDVHEEQTARHDRCALPSKVAVG